MAKLTVFFKYKAIDSYLFEKGVVHIGREETNDLTIDSLAVAPAHAAIITRDHICTVKQLNENFPLIVNGKKVKECDLNNNDTITIGKHDIVYNTTESIDPEPPQETENFDYSKTNTVMFDMDQELSLPPANLQVLNGANIGKVLPIKKSMTRLGNAGSGVVVISKRKDAYYISALEKKGTLKINELDLEDSNIKLSNNDIIVINQTSLQFFLS
ncbi:MAG: FHA domain-containing protein [Methylovulum sp.]|uniref:FHA domain-containing protein n=1 Tax=Methylovulum sp. TaxID=1916980 RepID=UPI00260CD97E|nr:FHA domain-containing protein [Methylovulum sp.]MDD2724913.1 FHA domain-containing protein [Methylovulum sp.]MDD5124283.1 FHA domain-containing protein [Methylovulum sp.]